MADAFIGEITDAKAMKAHFASGNLSRAYLFYGEEEYLKDLYVSRIKKQAVDDPMNIYLFTGRTDLDEIAEIVNGVSLFGERKLILVTGSGLFKSAAELSFLNDLEDGNCTIVFREESADKRLKAYKDMVKYGIVFECKRQTEKDILQMLSSAAKNAGRTLSPGAAELLIQGIGNDLTRLLSEMEKLILLVGDGDVIREHHVESACSLSLSARVFDLTDAVSLGNKTKAFAILQALLDDRESPQLILALLSRNWVSLYHAKKIVESGGGQGDIQRNLSVAPFVAKKLWEHSKKISAEAILDKIMLSTRMDESVKSGLIKDTNALELLIS